MDEMDEILKEYEKRRAEDEELDRIEAEREKKLAEAELILGDETLFIVKNNVQKLIKKHGLRVSYDSYDKLNKKVSNLIKEAIYRCKSSGRKRERRRTVLKHDF